MLAECSHYLDANGEKVLFTDAKRREFMELIGWYAEQSLRTISMGYKQVEDGDKVTDIKDGEVLYEMERGGFTLIAIAGIKDVIRPEVPSAVATCQRAGITVRMVTGDNLLTAKAIARECGILT